MFDQRKIFFKVEWKNLASNIRKTSIRNHIHTTKIFPFIVILKYLRSCLIIKLRPFTRLLFLLNPIHKTNHYKPTYFKKKKKKTRNGSLYIQLKPSFIKHFRIIRRKNKADETTLRNIHFYFSLI